MDNGIYTAFSGMQAKMDALEILSNNLANLNTTGFKEEKAFFTILNQSLESSKGSENLNEAVNQQVRTRTALNIATGSLTPSGRDLDIAIEGNGFLVVDTPRGIRYTRNGSLHLNAQSQLSTSEGFPIRGDNNGAIPIGVGMRQIGTDGAVSVNGVQVGRIKVVAFEQVSALQKEGNSLFVSNADPAAERASDATIRSGYLEQSNVNAVSSIVQMVDNLRQFESIKKSVDLIMNDINTKAIDRLGR
jgi:flagellar basal-body rod protein FlgF